MRSNLISDDVFTAARLALDGLSSRQSAISRNVANVDTPGYRAETVSFERAIKRAMGKDDLLSLKSTDEAHLPSPNQVSNMLGLYRKGGSLRADGNNVDIDVEMIDMNETVLKYQAISQLVSKRYRLLRDISNVR